MTNEKIKELCLSLIHCEREEGIVKILKKNHLWDDEHWHPYGDNENNRGTIGNQQDSADKALVEKLVNSIDAILIKECRASGIDPEGKDAPQDMYEAVKNFFKAENGKFNNLVDKQIEELSKKISLVATGSKQIANYIIADLGEGQTPQAMPHTLLSLSKGNKQKIPFVQGKFNMGSTGVLKFCSEEHNFQLILSKKYPEFVDKKDETSDSWGFTIVRRSEKDDRKDTIYEYLIKEKTNNKVKVFSFEEDSLNILPGDFTTPDKFPTAYGNPMSYGTFVKLYEYQLDSTYKQTIKRNLWERLSLLLPGLILPIKMFERRDIFKTTNSRPSDTYINLKGLNARLEKHYTDKDVLEDNFPLYSQISFNGIKIPLTIFAFKEDKKKSYCPDDEGVIFTVNGQYHGHEPDSFFKDFSNIKDSLLIVVDCNNLRERRKMFEDLFQASRDRMAKNQSAKILKEEIKSTIRDNQALRDLNRKRQEEIIKKKYQDNKALDERLKNVIQNTPLLAKILIEGGKLSSSYNRNESGKPFEGKEFPTYFEIDRKAYLKQDTPKIWYKGEKKLSIAFSTDAENAYFARDKDRGQVELYIDGDIYEDCVPESLIDGRFLLTIKEFSNLKIGNLHHCKLEVSDVSRALPIVNEFYIKTSDEKKPDSQKGPNQSRPTQAFLKSPEIFKLYKEEEGWKKIFSKNTDCVVIRYNSENDAYDIYMNMSNQYLLESLKNSKNESLLKAEYEMAMGLITIGSIYHYKEVIAKEEDDDGDIEDKIAQATSAASITICAILSASKAID